MVRFHLRELFLAKIEYLEVSFELKFQKIAKKSSFVTLCLRSTVETLWNTTGYDL